MAKPKKKGDIVNYYIPRAMADSLDKILEQVGKKHDIKSRSELISRALSTFIGCFEEDTYTKAILSTAKLGEDLKKDVPLNHEKIKHTHYTSLDNIVNK